jgi:hypothetical protein
MPHAHKSIGRAETLLRIPEQFGQRSGKYSDSIPIQIGHRSDLIRTAFRELFGQFIGTVGTVSEMGRNDTVGVE